MRQHPVGHAAVQHFCAQRFFARAALLHCAARAFACVRAVRSAVSARARWGAALAGTLALWHCWVGPPPSTPQWPAPALPVHPSSLQRTPHPTGGTSWNSALWVSPPAF